MEIAPEPTPSEVNDLLAAMVDLVSTWTSSSLQARIARNVGLAISEGDVRTIHTLGRLGEARPAELADAVHASRPTMSKSLARLSDAGLIARRTAVTDGRGAHITLTAEGKAAYEKLVDAGLVMMRQSLAEVPEMSGHTEVFTRFVQALRSTTNS